MAPIRMALRRRAFWRRDRSIFDSRRIDSRGEIREHDLAFEQAKSGCIQRSFDGLAGAFQPRWRKIVSPMPDKTYLDMIKKLTPEQFSEFAVTLSKRKLDQDPLRVAVGCFPPASPAIVPEAGKQKPTPRTLLTR